MKIEFVDIRIQTSGSTKGCLFLCFDLTPLLPVRKEYFRFLLGFSTIFKIFSKIVISEFVAVRKRDMAVQIHALLNFANSP